MERSLSRPGPMRGVHSARGILSGRVCTDTQGWQLDTVRGRVVELSGGAATAALTVAAGLILEAQTQGLPAAWVGEQRTGFYPPDFAARGIDLAALPVVRVDSLDQRLKALDALMRSGGFALILLDLGHERIPLGVQSRLAGLAKRHYTALVLLARSQGNTPSGNTLASLRCDTRKERTLAHHFTCRLEAVKDKAGSTRWEHEEAGDGPEGMG
jgi:recombination protein RecA